MISPVKRQRGLTDEQKTHVRTLRVINTKPLVILRTINDGLDEYNKVSKKQLNSYLSNLSRRITGSDGDTLLGIMNLIQANKYEDDIPDSKCVVFSTPVTLKKRN